jgi:hypothetical protein
MKTIKEWFDGPARWTKGYMASDGLGSACEYNEAACHCLYGAIVRKHLPDFTGDARYVVHTDVRADSRKAIVVIKELFPERILTVLGVHCDANSDDDPCILTCFNDHPDTTFPDILRVIEKAGV